MATQTDLREESKPLLFALEHDPLEHSKEPTAGAGSWKQGAHFAVTSEDQMTAWRCHLVLTCQGWGGVG